MANLNRSLSPTFNTIANIIAETCEIPLENITPESHTIDNLGIDSLDFLDIAFTIDKAFKIKLPLEQWTQEVNDGKATTDQYFVMQNLVDHVERLVAQKKGTLPKDPAPHPVQPEIRMAFENMRQAHAAAEPDPKRRRLPTIAERCAKLQEQARREREKPTS